MFENKRAVSWFNMSHGTIICPACGALSPSQRSYIAFCPTCGHRWLCATKEEHKLIESRTYLRDYAGYRPDPIFVERATAITQSELMPRVPPPSRLLDVGCGAGEFLMVAKSLGYQAQGIDISEASAEICRERGLDACAEDFLIYAFPAKFDLITMWDVVEHLRDPFSFFQRARSLLTKRGCLFAKIPAFGDISVALSNLWPRVSGTLLGAPGHVQYFDRESLAKLLSRTGFEAEWINAGGARSHVSGGPLRRRLARNARSAIGRISGDANVYFVARPIN